MIEKGSPETLGPSPDNDGTNFALYSSIAERVELCLFDDHGGQTERHDLPDCSDGADNDLDGLVDYPADTDCSGPSFSSEAPATIPVPALEGYGRLVLGILLGTILVRRSWPHRSRRPLLFNEFCD